MSSFNVGPGELLTPLELGFTTIFALEYLVRISTHPEPRKYIFSFYGAVDLLSVLPAFIALLLPDAQYLLVVRIVRMLRIFRVLKLTPYLSQANFLLVALQGSRQKIIVRSEEHTSELQSLMRTSYAVFCLTKKTIY